MKIFLMLLLSLALIVVSFLPLPLSAEVIGYLRIGAVLLMTTAIICIHYYFHKYSI